MIAALDLVRIYLRNARKIDDDAGGATPSFEEFREHYRAARPPLKILRAASSTDVDGGSCAASGKRSSVSIVAASWPS